MPANTTALDIRFREYFYEVQHVIPALADHERHLQSLS